MPTPIYEFTVAKIVKKIEKIGIGLNLQKNSNDYLGSIFILENLIFPIQANFTFQELSRGSNVFSRY